MVLRHGHQRLPTFGIGADRSREFWRGVIRQLIAAGMLRTESGEFASLALVADRARPVLRGEERVMLREEAATPPRARRERRPAAVAADLPAAPAGLFEALRAWRAAEAKAQAIPPYVIFHDSVLREIAAVRPASLAELGQIKGVGASKLDRYGVRVLDILARETVSMNSA
jgi:ATP-dependent DNA helicase RecQ